MEQGELYAAVQETGELKQRVELVNVFCSCTRAEQKSTLMRGIPDPHILQLACFLLWLLTGRLNLQA